MPNTSITIRAKLQNLNWDDPVEHLMALAYLAGQEDATRRICDEHNRRMALMREAAQQCRYHIMAQSVLDAAGGDIIYSEHYAGDVTAELCDDPFVNPVQA